MKKLIQAIVLAIAAVAGFKTTIRTQREEIDRLRAQVDAEAADDAARDSELEERRRLDADLEEANKKGDELAALLNEEPALPSVNSDTFEVTTGPTAPIQDLEFRDRESESTGQGSTEAFPPGPRTTEDGSTNSPSTESENAETVESLVENNTAEQLRERAEQAGVSTSGTKAEVAERVLEAEKQNTESQS